MSSHEWYYDAHAVRNVVWLSNCDSKRKKNYGVLDELAAQMAQTST